jgi:hydrogenase nickel incorporation protein HypA/HybF
MHELALMKDLMNKIESILEEERATRVLKVRVKLGVLSHLDHEHFLEHFRQAAQGTAAQDAEVETERTHDLNNPNAQGILLESIEID